MDVNHVVYHSDLLKIAFVLLFMTSESAATWKAQFIDEVNKKLVPTNPNYKLGQYADFRRYLVNAFLILRMKMGSSIDEHLAKFKMLAAEAQIDMSNALTIELLK